MGPAVAPSATARAATAPPEAVPFPSVQWFEVLGQLMHDQRDHFARIGDMDCTMQVSIFDANPDGSTWHCQVEFAGTEVAGVREVTEEDVEQADFVLETDLETWREMVTNIVDNGGKPDLDHTLNRLSLPGVPIRLWGVDPVRRDAYYRFNQSLQHFVNNVAAFRTVWPGDAAGGDGATA